MKRARQLPLWPTARVADEELLDGRSVLAANLRAFRQEQKLSQYALAERAGLHRSYVSAIERARHNVPLDTLCRLAWALGMEVRELLTPPPVAPDVAPRRRERAQRRRS